MMRQGDSSPFPLVSISPCLAFSSSHITVPLPDGHRFPILKYKALVEKLTPLGWQIKKAPKATLEDLQLVHTAAYLQKCFDLSLTPQEERKLGLPQSPQLLERSLCSVGGTLAALEYALEHRYGINLAGGTHHAFADRGEGFCVFNDLAVASRKARLEGRAEKILIIDLDVHQGNGTAKIFEDEPNVPEALCAMSIVVLTPHVASATWQTRKAMADLAFGNLQAHFAGLPLLTPVP